MSKVKFESEFGDSRTRIKVTLNLYLWKENGMHYVYSPSLDLTGYGNTEPEAKSSFEVTLGEFVKYTHNKQTIFEELEHLGWTVNKKKKKIHAPDLEDLLNENEAFRHIYESGVSKTETRNVELELA